MLSKIAIGTANFTQSYGILSKGQSLESQEVFSILQKALSVNIHTFDTAFSYGDLFQYFNKLKCPKDLKIITKFSVIDDYDELYNKLRTICDTYGLKRFYSLLVHDSCNLKKINKEQLRQFFNNIKETGIVEKIGVSIYGFEDLEQFETIISADLIQLPLNPFNQSFLSPSFQRYLQGRPIEIHARSLFLQGILLDKTLPISLKDLQPFWDLFDTITKNHTSRLEALLSWANSQKWIDKWILGVASLQDFDTILNQIKALDNYKNAPCFDKLQNINHPLIDPRNWKTK